MQAAFGRVRRWLQDKVFTPVAAFTFSSFAESSLFLKEFEDHEFAAQMKNWRKIRNGTTAVVKTMQTQCSVGFLLQKRDSTSLHVRFDMPTCLQAVDGTSGECAYQYLQNAWALEDVSTVARRVPFPDALQSKEQGWGQRPLQGDRGRKSV